MNRGQDGRRDQARITQRHKIQVAMDQVELCRPLKHFRDMQVFHHLGIDRPVLFIPTRNHGMQPGPGDRIGGCEQGHIPAPRHQPLRHIAGHRLPRPILPRRRAPRDWRQHCNPFSRQLLHLRQHIRQRHGREATGMVGQTVGNNQAAPM